MPHADTSSPPPPTTINSESSNEPKLYVNDGQLPEYGLLKPSSPSLPLTELHRRYEEDGYLFLKGLLPRPKVLTAREKYFSFMSPSGVLAPSTTPIQGIYDSSKSISQFPGIGAGAVGGNGHPGEQAATFVDLALLAHKEDWYAEDFCRMKELVDFVEYFTGWVGDVEESADGEGKGKRKRMAEFRRTLLRNSIPGTKAIGVHYDQIFLRYGEPTSVTAWVPMGDVGIQGGGLIYLENGAQLGKQFEDDFTAKAKASGLTDEQAKNAFNQNMLSTGLLADGPVEFGRTHGRRWLATDYEAGDVVLHNPYTIHASTINHDPNNVIRLATDIRFVDSSRPWDQRWNKTYELNDGV